jgi:hypothetical protein
MATTTKIIVGIDNQTIELVGADKEAFIAERQARQSQAVLLETESKAKREAALEKLSALGLDENDLRALGL